MFSILSKILSVARAEIMQIGIPGFKKNGLCMVEETVRIRAQKGQITLSPRCYLSRGSDLIVIGGNITIDGDFFCNKGCTLVSRDSISIGSGCRFGEYVSVYDHNHMFSRAQGVSSDVYKSKKVRIGKNCWLCRGAVILPGVVIGDNCLIGPNVVVRTSIPDGSIIVSDQ